MKTITVELTVDEARALFMECTCCAPPELHAHAQLKIYAALIEAGEFEGEK